MSSDYDPQQFGLVKLGSDGKSVAEENDATPGEAGGVKTHNTKAGGTTARDTRARGQPARETRNEEQRRTERHGSERERSQGQERSNGRTGERHRALDLAHS